MPREKIVWLVAANAEGREVLRAAADTLDGFGLGWREVERKSTGQEAVEGGCAVIVASPDADLPSQWARETRLPTLRVPVAGEGKAGLALLWDERGNLPGGEGDEAFATMAVGVAGAKNAALFVVAALAVDDAGLGERWREFRVRQTAAVLEGARPALGEG